MCWSSCQTQQNRVDFWLNEQMNREVKVKWKRSKTKIKSELVSVSQTCDVPERTSSTDELCLCSSSEPIQMKWSIRELMKEYWTDTFKDKSASWSEWSWKKKTRWSSRVFESVSKRLSKVCVPSFVLHSVSMATRKFVQQSLSPSRLRPPGPQCSL